MDYEITRLDEHAYRISSPMGVHMDLLVGSDKALLWDTGYGIGNLKETVRNITDLPLCIVNSHGHVDHACGNYQFEEPIYIHPLDMEVCRRHTARLMRVLAVEYGRSLSEKLRQEIDGWRAGNQAQAESLQAQAAVQTQTVQGLPPISHETYLNQGAGNLIPVEEGQVFDLGGLHLRVVELPGHTQGSIGLLYEEKRVLYVGDAVNDNLWLFLPEAGDLATYMKTVEKIKSMNCRKLVFSHKPGCIDPAVLDDYMELARDLAAGSAADRGADSADDSGSGSAADKGAGSAAGGYNRYEKGIPFSAPLVPGATARLCCRRGYQPEDTDKPGFASIVINRDHL